MGVRINKERSKHHNENSQNPEAAVDRELLWWKETSTGPTNEEEFIRVRAPKLKELLSPHHVKDLTEDQFIEVCSLFYAFTMVAKPKTNEELGIPQSVDVDIETKKELLAKKIYSSRSLGGKRVTEVLDYLFYSGKIEDVVHRLYQVLDKKEYDIRYFGESCYGELVGWALPDDYPPRNDRTNKALKGLGYNVDVRKRNKK